MCDTKKYSTVPDNADKVLFAEDFVNHVLQNHNLPLLSSGIADHRDFIYKAFNPQVGMAANHVANILRREMRSESQTTVSHRISDFTKYAISLSSRTLEKMRPFESGAKMFLEFCFKISTMAVEFHHLKFPEAPGLAVEHIINILDGINMVDEGGWEALHLVAADYSQRFADWADDTPDTASDAGWLSADTASDADLLSPESASDADLLTPESETTDYMSSSSSSGEDSKASHLPHQEMNQDDLPERSTDDYFCTTCVTAMCTSSEGQASSSLVCTHLSKTEDSRSPDNEFNGRDNQDELPENLTHSNFCTTCINAMIIPSEGQDSSSFVCEHVEKTIDVVSENIEIFSDNKSDSLSAGSSKEKDSEDSFHSFEETSSEDDISKQKKLKKLRMKPSFMHSKDSDSDSEKGGTDIAKAD